MRASVWLAVLAVWPSGPLAAQCPDGSPPPCGARPASVPAATSLAVLYFESQSPDTNDAYLADGITEEVIQTLAGVTRLQVQNRHAVRRFRTGPVNNPSEVGRALNVAYLVTGTVRRSGARLRISAELTRAGSGVQVWGRRYDRGTEDLLDIQEDIARQVASGIVGRLLPGERAAIGTHPTSDPNAYAHFLQGNFYLAQREGRLFPRVVEEYREALRLDPEFIQPLGRLAYAYGLALSWDWPVPDISPDSVLAEGLALANRALSRDPRDAEGWLALGHLRVHADPVTYAGARQALERAVELDSGNAEAWHQYGSVLSELGDDSASAAAFRRALDIDPERGISWLELSLLSTVGRRYDESLGLLDQATAVAPELGFARYHRALLLLVTGDTARARIDAEWIRARGGIEFADILLARIAARSGDREAFDLARSRVVAWADSFPAPVRNADADDFIVFVLPALLDVGERERALRLLESVTPKGRIFSFWLRWPSCDPLREEPRFKRLVEEAR